MKFSKKIIIRAIISVIAVCIIAFGLSFIINSGLGSDSLNVFYNGLTKTVGFTHGTWTTIFSAIMICSIIFLNKKRIGFTTIMYLCFAQFIMDPTIAMLKTPDMFIMKVLMCLFGIVVTSIGCGLCIASDMGLCVYDAFTFAIPDRFHLDFVRTRWAIEIVFMLVGVILGGTIGIGTIICTIGFGPLIKFSGKLMKKPVDKIVG